MTVPRHCALASSIRPRCRGSEWMTGVAPAGCWRASSDSMSPTIHAETSCCSEVAPPPRRTGPNEPAPTSEPRESVGAFPRKHAVPRWADVDISSHTLHPDRIGIPFVGVRHPDLAGDEQTGPPGLPTEMLAPTVSPALWRRCPVEDRFAEDGERRVARVGVRGGIDCLFMPIGTVLGVLTIIVLMRPSVKSLLESAAPAAVPASP